MAFIDDDPPCGSFFAQPIPNRRVPFFLPGPPDRPAKACSLFFVPFFEDFVEQGFQKKSLQVFKQVAVSFVLSEHISPPRVRVGTRTKFASPETCSSLHLPKNMNTQET